MDAASTKPAPYVYQCVHKETGEFYIGFREGNVTKGRCSDMKRWHYDNCRLGFSASNFAGNA